MLFFSSDLHFGGDQTLINDCRPFNTSKKFFNYVKKLWNKQTTKDDIIYILGDFVDCHNKDNLNWANYIKKVKQFRAKIVLILGNNEERIIKYFFKNNKESFCEYCKSYGFLDVVDTAKIMIKNTEFNLVHKPVQCDKQKLNLFGHSHRAIGLYKPYGFNVGCDNNHFKLFSEKDIEHLLFMKEKYWDIDENLK